MWAWLCGNNLRWRLVLIFKCQPRFLWWKLMEQVVAELHGVKWNGCLLPTCFISLASCRPLMEGSCCTVTHIQGYILQLPLFLVIWFFSSEHSCLCCWSSIFVLISQIQQIWLKTRFGWNKKLNKLIKNRIYVYFSYVFWHVIVSVHSNIVRALSLESSCITV